MTTLQRLPDKLCTRCTVVKPRSEFSERTQTPSTGKSYRATNAYCKACAAEIARARHHQNREANNASSRRYKLKATYGLTLDQYDQMLALQGGGCAICGTATPGGKGRFHVDHCHASGKVRGLLCCNCNRGIGALRDDPNLLRRAIGYLEEHGG